MPSAEINKVEALANHFRVTDQVKMKVKSGLKEQLKKKKQTSRGGRDCPVLLHKQGESIWSGDLMDFNLTPGIWAPYGTQTFLSGNVYKDLEKQQQFRKKKNLVSGWKQVIKKSGGVLLCNKKQWAYK